MDNEILTRLIVFTANFAGIPVKKITRDAELEKDLGIYGDDAVDFILTFSKEFNVDVSRFMAADYISPEGDDILPAMLRMFTGEKHPKQKDLTIGHLEKAIAAGRLDEEIIHG